MDLGAFSISLAVKDLSASRAFYEKLGFEVTGGSEDESYLILMNGEALIGLFQGMFDKNILTFNPGLNNRKERLEEFTDVREIQRTLKELEVEVLTEVDESTSGAGSIVPVDPDDNQVLIDQFF